MLRPCVLTIRPSATNMSLTSMAEVNSPPGLNRRSMISPLSPCACRSSQGPLQIGGRVAAEGRHADVADVLVGIEHEVPSVVGLAVVAQDRLDVDHFARHADGFGLVGRRRADTVNETLVPASPLSRLTASSIVMPSVVLPSISRMLSPACRPAR